MPGAAGSNLTARTMPDWCKSSIPDFDSGGPGSNPGSGATYADVLKRLKRSLPKSDRQATARGFKSYHRRHKHEWRNGNTRRTKDPVPAEGV